MRKASDDVTHTNLAIASASSLVLSFPLFEADLSAVASLFPAARPAGQRGGGLARRPLSTWVLCFGRPL